MVIFHPFVVVDSKGELEKRRCRQRGGGDAGGFLGNDNAMGFFAGGGDAGGSRGGQDAMGFRGNGNAGGFCGGQRHGISWWRQCHW